MEFRIKLITVGLTMGRVYLVSFDLDTERQVDMFDIWRPEWRVSDVNQSALMAGRCWAQSFAEFTGFDLVEE